MRGLRNLGPRLPLILILVNGLSVVLFRFFISVDGPMHVLHASVTQAEWSDQRYSTPTISYESRLSVLDVKDLFLLPFTSVLPPYWAHACFCAVVLVVLGLGLLYLIKAYGAVDPWAFVVVLPFFHSFLLMMGFFMFLLALGVAFAFAGYWARGSTIGGKRLLLLVAGVFLCAAMHRSGAQVLLSLVLAHEALNFVQDRSQFRARWSFLPRYARISLVLAGAAVIVLLLVRIAMGDTHFEHAEPRDPTTDLVRLRPLLLVDSVAERPFLFGFGGLILVLLVIAGWSRWQRDRKWLLNDALWICGAGALILSFCVRGPYADLIYLVERLQFIGLLLLCAWLMIQWRPKGWLKALAVCVLLVQVARVVFLEGRLLPLRATYEAAMEVPQHLTPHQVVLPVLRENNWILDHLGAFVSIRYKGVLFSPHDHMGFLFKTDVSRALRRYAWGNRTNVPWLRQHLESRQVPIIDQLVVLGNGEPRNAADSAILAVRETYFMKRWENSYAEVWVRK